MANSSSSTGPSCVTWPWYGGEGDRTVRAEVPNAMTSVSSTELQLDAAAAAAPAEPAPPERSLRPDIEGLRAVAVIAVILFHMKFPGVAGGYVGVDVFFVLSGFLITSLLVDERARRGVISLRRFYGRRARRLLPASALVVLVTLAL